MKKTLIALVALTGVASAAWTADDAAGWVVNNGDGTWTSGSSTTYVIDGESNDMKLTFQNDEGTDIVFAYNNDPNKPTSFRSCYTFAVTINLDALTLPASNTSEVWGGNKVGFGLTSAGLVTACIGGNPAWANTGITVGDSGQLTLIVTSGNSGSIIAAYGADGTYTSVASSQTGSNKVNGVTTDGGTYYGWTGLKEGEALTTFTIDASILSAVEKIAVWTTGPNDGLKTDAMLANIDTVAAAIQSIPEPTTATLSLLALAGLAARRRRR